MAESTISFRDAVAQALAAPAPETAPKEPEKPAEEAPEVPAEGEAPETEAPAEGQEPAPAEGEPQPEAKPAVTPSIDDQVIELTIDGEKTPWTIAQMKREVQQGVAAGKRLKDASIAKAEYEQKVAQAKSILDGLAKNPMGTMLDSLTNILGSRQMAEARLYEHAEAFLVEKLKEAAMTPEERAKLDHERQVAQRERAIAEKEAKQAQSQQAALLAQARVKVMAEISSAMSATGLDKGGPETTAELTRHIALKMQEAHRDGYALTPREAAAIVREEVPVKLQALAKLLPHSEKRQALEAFTKELREADIAEVKGKLRASSTLAGKATNGSTAPAVRRDQSPKKIGSTSAFRKQLSQYT